MKMKVIKIGSLIYGGGKFLICHDFNDGVTPFRVYRETCYKDNRHDYPTKHRKFVGKYANLVWCMDVIRDAVAVYEFSK